MTVTFPRRIVVIDTPDDVPAAALVLNTSRPLYGDSIDIGLRGFTVVADGLDDNLLRRNRELDAHQLIFVTVADGREWMRAKLVAEYGDIPSFIDDEVLDATFAQMTGEYLIDTFGVAA